MPNPYEIVGSLESESIVKICGSSEATEELVIVSLAIAPDNCVELRMAGVLFRAGLPSSDERSTEKTSDSVDEESKERSGLIAIVKDREA